MSERAVTAVGPPPVAAAIAERLRGARSVLVVSHESPDGDSLGSQLALARLLEPYVERLTLLGSDPVPHLYRWLPGQERIRRAARWPEPAEVIVALECRDLGRSGIAELRGEFLVNIDHHEMNDHFGDLNWVDPRYSSVGEMVYQLGLALDGGEGLAGDAAVNLYTAILTDTGGFRFSNTTPEALRVCARLAELGADPTSIAFQIYENHSFPRIKLLGPALSTLTRDRCPRAAWLVVRQRDLEATGASVEDAEGIINHPRSIGELEVVALFREQADGGFRVSLRSRSEVDVAALAARFGGGGHIRAAGLTVAGPLEEAVEKVMGAVRGALTGATRVSRGRTAPGGHAGGR